jgi:hypothetical protein
MRATEFITLEQKLDEVIPLITNSNSLAVAKQNASVTNKQTKTMGTIGTVKTKGTMQQQTKQTPEPADITQAEIQIDKAIQPGKQIPLPTAGTGRPQNFRITAVKGDEVELENPDGHRDPNQPNKLTYKRKDIKKSIAI